MSSFSPLHVLIVLVACTGHSLADTDSRSLDNICSPTRSSHVTQTPPQICLPSEDPILQWRTVPSEILATHGSKSDYRDTVSSTSLAVLEVSTITHPSATTYLTVSGSSVASAAPSDAVGLSQLDVVEDESALESGNFLSFEDWKRQNLKKAGQSEHVGSMSRPDLLESRKRPGGGQNTLDSLGDDLEIDIDFGGLMPDMTDQSPKSTNSIKGDDTSGGDESKQDRKGSKRSRDAGTTCKERFNYASFDCAANVLKTNPEAKSPNTILVENKDSYMLNVCSAKEKFIVLELCNDILVDTIVLANFEFFSSTFRTFRVSVSDRYPVKADKWKLIGTYEARNTRGIQAFLVEDPIIWARYVRVDFLTHYGTEFYCPISLVRIHGTTMMDEYKNDMELNTGTEYDEIDAETTADTVSGATEEDRGAHAESVKRLDAVVVDIATAESVEIQGAQPKMVVYSYHNATNTTSVTNAHNTSASTAAFDALSAVIASANQCRSSDGPLNSTRTSVPLTSTRQATESLVRLSTNTPSPVAVENRQRLHADTNSSHSVTPPRSAASSSAAPPASSVSADQGRLSVNASQVTAPSSVARASTRSNASTTDKVQSTSSTVQAQAATPTVQESFFKSVQKRLQMLESNSSLSLQYIEDQSRALRDALKKVEQRQLAKTTVFLEHLNVTVLNELREFRQQYDQLWQSTVIELAIQRERHEKDNVAMNARLGVLTDEVIFHRRMGMLQMCLVLVCLVLVLFSRGTINNYLELPIVQNMLAKSQHSRWLNLSGVDSPARKPSAIRTRSAQQLRTASTGSKGHQRMPSKDSLPDQTRSSPETHHLAQPVTSEPTSDADVLREEGLSTDLDSEKDETPMAERIFSPDEIERPMTSPPRLIIDPGTPADSEGVVEILPDNSSVVSLQDQGYITSTSENIHGIREEVQGIYMTDGETAA